LIGVTIITLAYTSLPLPYFMLLKTEELTNQLADDSTQVGSNPRGVLHVTYFFFCKTGFVFGSRCHSERTALSLQLCHNF